MYCWKKKYQLLKHISEPMQSYFELSTLTFGRLLRFYTSIRIAIPDDLHIIMQSGFDLWTGQKPDHSAVAAASRVVLTRWRWTPSPPPVRPPGSAGAAPRSPPAAGATQPNLYIRSQIAEQPHSGAATILKTRCFTAFGTHQLLVKWKSPPPRSWTSQWSLDRWSPVTHQDARCVQTGQFAQRLL